MGQVGEPLVGVSCGQAADLTDYLAFVINTPYQVRGSNALSTMLSFSPKNITKELLAELPDRSRKVLIDRFGLAPKGESRTLDAIGKEYGITRERIRQLQNLALRKLRRMIEKREPKQP